MSTNTDKHLSEYQLEEMFNEMLDECYGIVNVAGFDYDTSYVLKEIDPIAYRVGMSDYADSLAEDGYTVEGWQ